MSNLPSQPTPFIGRAQELAQISQLLDNPACRLLTLVGPGGIGKTRLAIEVAEHLDAYASDVYFIALQPIQTVDFLVPAIADAAGIVLGGHDPLSTQLLNNLSGKHLLLLLDNFEHLLAGANLLVEILDIAPGLKLLVTSREVIGVREEWLYAVDGLSVPTSVAAHNPVTDSAVQLFGERARQVRHDFILKDDIEAVISICQQVEGNPLAVELAASWLAVLSCKAIDAQIYQSLDMLATTVRNVPERHRSMRAVFDQSWQLLSEDERTVFCQLTVFQGGFTHHAARAVAGASLPLLSSLLSKSLLRRLIDGRYEIHELLRQYGAEKLAASPVLETAAHTSHSAYFMAFLAERRFKFDGHGQFQAIQEIAVELENIRSAWQWAVNHEHAEAIRTALRSLFFFYQHRSRYLEGAETFANAIHHLESQEVRGEHGAALAESLTYFGWLCIRLSQLPEAQEALARGEHLYDTLHIPPPQYRAGNPVTAMLILALVKGDYDQALALGEEACRQAEQHNQPAALAFAYYGIANALLYQGKDAQARAYAEQALALNNAIGNRWLASYAHEALGQIASVQEEWQAAKRHFEAAFTIRAEFEDPGGMALHLKNLGDIAVRQQDWFEAQRLYERSLDLYRELGDRGGVAGTQRGLAIVAYRTGALDSAHRYFRRALEIAMAAEVVPLTLSILADAGEFLSQIGGSIGKALGLRILTFVRQHPMRDRLTHDRIVRYLTQHGYPLDAHPEPQDTLASLTAALQAELVASEKAVPAMPRTQAQGLVEPLTEREIEVLRLIARGQSNPAIAEELMVAVGTVKAHTSSIYRKLDVANRTQAVAYARQLGIIL